MKTVQIMTFDDIELFHGKVNYGEMLEHKISWKEFKYKLMDLAGDFGA